MGSDIGAIPPDVIRQVLGGMNRGGMLRANGGSPQGSAAGLSSLLGGSLSPPKQALMGGGMEGQGPASLSALHSLGKKGGEQNINRAIDRVGRM